MVDTILGIPNWNGHLFLAEKNDTSVSKVFKNLDFEHKQLVKITKNDIEKSNKEIYDISLELFSSNKNVLSITGDHSNSYALLSSFAKSREGKEYSVVIFDAHPDVEVGTGKPSHEDYLRFLIEEKKIDPKQIYLFGLRTFSRTEFDYIVEKEVNFWSITDVLTKREEIERVLREDVKGEVYLSVDVDVMDPDDAPGTYYREYCGLHIQELLDFISIIKPKVVSSDITEYFSEKDEDEVTLKNVFKIIEALK